LSEAKIWIKRLVLASPVGLVTMALLIKRYQYDIFVKQHCRFHLADRRDDEPGSLVVVSLDLRHNKIIGKIPQVGSLLTRAPRLSLRILASLGGGIDLGGVRPSPSQGGGCQQPSLFLFLFYFFFLFFYFFNFF
jgi:hypothetical protein